MSLSGIVMRAGAATARGVYVTGLQSSTAAGSALAVTGRRGMTTFQEREKGEETVYMRREDKRLLEKLLEKERAAADGKDNGRTELMSILGGHKLPADVISSLLKWKSS